MVELINWRSWILILVIILYLLLLFTILPFMFIELQHNNTNPLIEAWFIGGLFVLLALPISLWSILQHLINYTEPNLQRHIIRILWMVPIYAINSWFALRFEKTGIYLDTARECYEAYVILNFFKYLINFLKINHPFLESDLASKSQVQHIPPACCVPPWKMGRQFISRCRHGVLQYTVLRIATTLIAFVCAMCGQKFYGEGDFNFVSAWSYLVVVNNLSQIYAMYCLIMFYKATRMELEEVHPVGKFLCVKFVVFLSFWQSLLITGLVNTNIIVLKDISKPQTSNAIQNVCICVEMFFAAIAHFFSFPYSPFIDKSLTNYANKSCFKSFKSMWDVSDVRRDLTDHITYVGTSATSMLRNEINNGNRDNLEVSPLLDDSMETNEQISLVTFSADMLTNKSDSAKPEKLFEEEDISTISDRVESRVIVTDEPSLDSVVAKSKNLGAASLNKTILFDFDSKKSKLGASRDDDLMTQEYDSNKATLFDIDAKSMVRV